jgi:hypothetical protein
MDSEGMKKAWTTNAFSSNAITKAAGKSSGRVAILDARVREVPFLMLSV